VDAAARTAFQRGVVELRDHLDYYNRLKYSLQTPDGWTCRVATAGILARMWLEGRPPVTNLYSSALFIGWGSVALCLSSRRLPNAIGSAAAG
jgi:ABC-type transport system involved in cytochrome c biogenesis permease subunit